MFFYRNPLKWVQDQKLIPDDPDGSPGGDAFGGYGSTMSIDGDLLGIAAIYDEQGEEQNAGSVYLFKELNGEYQQVQVLTASTEAPKAESRFGIGSVITKGKEKIFISAYRSNDKLTNAGSVYVFQTSSLGYQQIQIITSSGDADPAGDRFGGFKIATSGDGNTVAIPAFGSDENGTAAGSVYIFVSGSTGYTEVQKLTASGADIDPAGDEFGYSISMDENAQIIAVGAWAEQQLSTGLQADGAVYIFESGSNGYSQTQKIEGYGNIFSGSPLSWFGYDLKLTPDGEKLVVAARYEDQVDKPGVGTVNVFKRISNQYVLEQKIAPEFNNDNQNITVIDINEDATVIMAISTQYETGYQNYNEPLHAGPSEGAVFIFQSGSNGYEQFQKLTIEAPMALNAITRFDGAMNAQGTRMLIGYPSETEQGGEDRSTAKGAAYIFKLTRDY